MLNLKWLAMRSHLADSCLSHTSQHPFWLAILPQNTTRLRRNPWLPEVRGSRQHGHAPTLEPALTEAAPPRASTRCILSQPRLNHRTVPMAMHLASGSKQEDLAGLIVLSYHQSLRYRLLDQASHPHI